MKYGPLSGNRVKNRWDQVAEIPILGSATSLIRIPVNILQGLWAIMNLVGRGLAGSSQEYTKKQFKASSEGLMKGCLETIPFVAFIFNTNIKMAKNLSDDDLKGERQKLTSKNINAGLSSPEHDWFMALDKENRRRMGYSEDVQHQILSTEEASDFQLENASSSENDWLEAIFKEAASFVKDLDGLQQNEWITSLSSNLRKFIEIGEESCDPDETKKKEINAILSKFKEAEQFLENNPAYLPNELQSGLLIFFKNLQEKIKG